VKFSRRYAKMITADFDMTTFATLPAVEDGVPSDGREQRRNQKTAAPGELRATMVGAAKKRGCQVDEVDPKNITQECSFCGCTEKWDAKVSVLHTCPQCGRTWDQDYNACRNHLKRAGIIVTEPPTPKIGVVNSDSSGEVEQKSQGSFAQGNQQI
jgi:hypothetical protein